jgi:ferredoxin
MARFQIVIGRSLCTGYGVCEIDAPGLIEIDDDGIAGAPSTTDSEAALVAARSCPMGAIRVVDLETGRAVA